MADLRRIKTNGLDIVVDVSWELGQVFASIKTVALVTGVSIEAVKEVIQIPLENEVIDVNCVFYRASVALDTLEDSPFSSILEAQGFLNERRIATVMQKYTPDLFHNIILLRGIRGFFRELAGLKTHI